MKVSAREERRAIASQPRSTSGPGSLRWTSYWIIGTEGALRIIRIAPLIEFHPINQTKNSIHLGATPVSDGIIINVHRSGFWIIVIR